jgi:hypothetical protein
LTKEGTKTTMYCIRETLNTPIRGKYQVIVVGGGPAGIAAALSAARHGASVLLVECYGFLGGMWTAGMVNPLFDYENKGGICQELVDAIERAGMGVRNGPDIWNFDIETMKRLLEDLLRGAGVTLLYHTWFAEVVMEGASVQGIIVENKGGRAAYLASIVIDCTGDGDVASRAGAPFEIGNQDGMTQPMTMMMRISNCDYIQDYYKYPHHSGNELMEKLDAAFERSGQGDIRLNYRRPCVLQIPGIHQALIQTTHIRGKLAIDPFDLTEAEIEGRRLAAEFLDLLKTWLPQFTHAHLDSTGPHIGIRESRRIMGEYILTIEDIQEQRRFSDGITTVRFWVDIHQPDGDDQNIQNNNTLHTNYQIPYRCLVPLKVENLLVAGRCISGSFEAHASYRVTGNCVAMGQAAGSAAVICVEEDCMPRTLAGERVARRMEEDGAKI